MQPRVTIRDYWGFVTRRWAIILGGTLVAIAASAVVSFYLAATAPEYEAAAGVLITRPKYELSFDPKFKTVTAPLELAKARLDALLEIAISPEVESASAAQLRDLLPAEMRRPLGLRPSISVSAKGDLIWIKARARTPDQAARTATTWGRVFVSRVLEVFGQSAQALADIEKQVQDAEKKYTAVSQAYVDFLGSTPLQKLQTELKEKKDLTEALQGGKVKALKGQLEDSLGSLTQVERLIGDSKALRDQVRQGGNSTAGSLGEALALVILEARAFNPVLPTLQVPLEEMSRRADDPQRQVQDLDALISGLQARRRELLGSIQELSEQVAIGTSSLPGFSRKADALTTLVDQLVAEQSRLGSEVEAETQRKEQLDRELGLAKTSYTTLLTRAEETRLATAAAGSEAVLVIEAVPPTGRSSPSIRQNVLVAGLAGLVLATLAAVILEALGTARPVASRAEPPQERPSGPTGG